MWSKQCHTCQTMNKLEDDSYEHTTHCKLINWCYGSSSKLMVAARLQNITTLKKMGGHCPKMVKFCWLRVLKSVHEVADPML